MAIDYEGLEIEISRCCCGQLEVRILDSPVDRPRERFELTDHKLKSLWQRIERYNSMVVELSTGSHRQRRDLATEIGVELFELLTPGRVGRSLREALLLLDREREERSAGRRLRLSFGAGKHFDARVANLPWELIYDPEGGGRFLAGEPQTQIVRYLEITRRIRALPMAPPIKVLAVLASPTTQHQIDLETQRKRLQEAVEQHPGRIDLHHLFPATLESLKITLAEHEDTGSPFHVLHFLGHGELTDAGEGALYFEAEDRSEHIVVAEVLARQLAAFRDLQLVLLASCAGARLPLEGGRTPFTGSASALVAANVPAVVAMQFSVSETAAAAFTAGFYAKLGAGASLVEAVAEGRLRISAEDTEGTEWATPVLFLRSAEGKVLELREPVEEKQAKGPDDRVSVAVRSQMLNATNDALIAGVNRASSPRSWAGSVDVELESGEIDAGGNIQIVGVQEG